MGKRIPVKAAKEVANNYDKDQVILLCFGRGDGKTWVTTYGKTVVDCDQAAQAGNWLKEHFLHWEDHVDEPKRVTRMKKEIKELKAEVKELKSKE